MPAILGKLLKKGCIGLKEELSHVAKGISKLFLNLPNLQLV